MEAQGCPDFDGAGLGLRWATCSGYAGLLANLADDLGPSARSSRVIRPLRLPRFGRMLATPMVLSRVLDTSIDIDAPPQRVWDVLLDLRAWQEWNPFIPFITGTPGGTLSWTNIGMEKSPFENIVTICVRWDRIACMFWESLLSLTVTSIAPPSEYRRK